MGILARYMAYAALLTGLAGCQSVRTEVGVTVNYGPADVTVRISQ